MRCVRVLVTTYAPARAKACSMGPATSASSAEKATAPGSGGAHSAIVRSAIAGGRSLCSLHRTTSPKRLPALADDAATAAISNQGWSARSRTNFWPTVPVAPRMQTGDLRAHGASRERRSAARRT